jgi:flagellar motility protein MotE (MotC chaperone)
MRDSREMLEDVISGVRVQLYNQQFQLEEVLKEIKNIRSRLNKMETFLHKTDSLTEKKWKFSLDGWKEVDVPVKGSVSFVPEVGVINEEN